MNRLLKSSIAAVFALVVASGAVSAPLSGFIGDISVSVSAEDYTTVSFDEATGVLTLSGNVIASEVQAYAENTRVTSIVANEGAVLPQNCNQLFCYQVQIGNDWQYVGFTNVKHIDLSKARTSNVTNMGIMFGGLSALESIDISSFDTSNVTNMTYMFDGCSKLTTLDLSSFDTSSVTNMTQMFHGCSNLTSIIVSTKWDVTKVTDSEKMFDGCHQLVGGKGTKLYENSSRDKSYARIDGGEGNIGYLTGVFSLTLPDQMEIVTDAEATAKHGEKYLVGAKVTIKAKNGYTLSNVKVNGSDPVKDNYDHYKIIFDDINDDATVTADYGYTDEIGVNLAGYSLSLDGDIAVNFYMELDTSVAESQTAYMTFALPNKDDQKIYVKDARKDTELVPGKTYYVFKCNVSAKEMADTISARFFKDDSHAGGTIYTYSVREYADALLASPEKYSEHPEQAEALVKAMLVYGGAAQRYFEHNTGKYADDGITYNGDEFAFDGYVVKPADDANSGISYYGTSLLMKTQIIQRHYFKVDDITKYSFFIDDAKVDPVQYKDGSDYYYIETKPIKPDALGTAKTIKVNDGTSNVISFSYSPMDYAKTAINDNTDVKDLALKMYWYWHAAYNYEKVKTPTEA